MSESTDEKDDRAHPLGRKLLFLENDTNLKRIIVGLAIFCALLFLADPILHRHDKFAEAETWGFYALAGFAAFSFIIISTKYLQMLIGRREDYYGDGAIDREPYPPLETEVKGHRDD